MKAGDLVKCLFQPSVSRINKDGCADPMVYVIREQLGVYIKHRGERSGIVSYPQFGGYKHSIAWSALRVISESR